MLKIWNTIRLVSLYYRTNLMEKYLVKITPKVSQAWRTDELFLKVKGNKKYLYALMDDDTRFWISQQVVETKYDADIKPMFKKGKELMGTKPLTLISDGAMKRSIYK